MIKVSSSNDSDSKSAVRIYINDVLVITEYVSKRNPVAYLKKLGNSKHLRSIELQLLPLNLTLTDVGLR